MIFFGGRGVSLRRDDGMVPHTVLRMVQRTPEYTSECRLKGGVARGCGIFPLFHLNTFLPKFNNTLLRRKIIDD